MFKLQEKTDDIQAFILKDEVDPALLCSQCSEAKLDEKQCKKCHKLFCSSCTSKALQQNPFCPSCFVVPFKIKKLSPTLQAQLELILMKCPNKECEEIITISTFEHHKKVCDFQTVTCSNLNCEYKCQRNQLKDHTDVCPNKNKSSKCPRCSQNFEKNERHDCLVNYQSMLKQFTDDKQNMQKLVNSTQIILSHMLFVTKSITVNQQIEDKNANKEEEEHSVKEGNDKRCKLKHLLKWIHAVYNERCETCNQTYNICRYQCETCNEYYCQSCVKPTFRGNICPDNHSMQYAEQASYSLTCDFCRERPYENNVGVFMDRKCNFDICYTCYEGLCDLA